MVSRNNQWRKLQQQAEQVPRFGIRKLTVGVSSVLLGLSFMGINTTAVKADTVTPMTVADDTSVLVAQGTAVTRTAGESANPQMTSRIVSSSRQQLADVIKQAQDAGVNVTKSGTKVISGTDAADAEKQAAADYESQTAQVKQALTEQQKANTQSQSEYNQVLEKYQQALRDKGYPVSTGALTGNDIQQNLIIGDEPNVVVNGTVADSRLTIETGDDKDYLYPTFPSQGKYHEIVFKDNNSTAVGGKLGEFVFTNLQNSYYEGRKIGQIVVTFSNLQRDGLTDSHFGKHCVVIYDNLAKGLEFAGTSIEVTYRFYDGNGRLIILNTADSYIVPASLNNHGNSPENVNIESVELLSAGKAEQLLGSTVVADGNKEYATQYNDGAWDKSVTDDPHGERTYGAGLYNVSGDHVTLRFYTQLSSNVADYLNSLTPDQWNNGSMWAIVQTVIPTYDDPLPPVKKNSNAKAAYHDIELHVTGHQHITINVPNNKSVAVPDDQSYTFTKVDGDWDSTHQFDNLALAVIPGYHVDSVTVNGQRVDNQVRNNVLTGQKVMADRPNADVVVNYAADNQSTHIVYRDKDGHTIKTDTITGQTGQTVKTSSGVPDGWQLVSGQTVPSEITFTGSQTPDTEVFVQHKYDLVKPGDQQPTGALPGNHTKNYPQLADLTKAVYFIVHVMDPRTGEVTTKTQKADFVRQAEVDEVTGDVKYTDWKAAVGQISTDRSPDQALTFADAAAVPTIPGYTVHSHRGQLVTGDIAPVAESDLEIPDADLLVTAAGSVSVKGDRHVTAVTPDRLVEVTYTANPRSGKIIYVNPSGELITTTPITGATGQTIPFTPQIPAGYELVPGQDIPTEITFNDDGQPVIVKVVINKFPVWTDSHGEYNGQRKDRNDDHFMNIGAQTRTVAKADGQNDVQELPQTGTAKEKALIGLGLAGIALSVFGLKKEKTAKQQVNFKLLSIRSHPAKL